MLIIILLSLLGLAVLVAAVAVCGQAGIERSQQQAGIYPSRKTTGRV